MPVFRPVPKDGRVLTPPTLSDCHCCVAVEAPVAAPRPLAAVSLGAGRPPVRRQRQNRAKLKPGVADVCKEQQERASQRALERERHDDRSARQRVAVRQAQQRHRTQARRHRNYRTEVEVVGATFRPEPPLPVAEPAACEREHVPMAKDRRFFRRQGGWLDLYHTPPTRIASVVGPEALEAEACTIKYLAEKLSEEDQQDEAKKRRQVRRARQLRAAHMQRVHERKAEREGLFRATNVGISSSAQATRPETSARLDRLSQPKYPKPRLECFHDHGVVSELNGLLSLDPLLREHVGALAADPRSKAQGKQSPDYARNQAQAKHSPDQAENAAKSTSGQARTPPNRRRRPPLRAWAPPRNERRSDLAGDPRLWDPTSGAYAAELCSTSLE